MKVVSADTLGILPHHYEGVLHDVKVFVRYGPDDPVYDNNKDIRDRVGYFKPVYFCMVFIFTETFVKISHF